MQKPNDKIIIRDLLLSGIIGAYPEERNSTQSILFNIEIDTDTRPAAEQDDYTLSIDYAEICKQIEKHLQTSHPLTVEALAQQVADICLEQPLAIGVLVQIEKPQAIETATGVGVRIYRSKTI